MEEKELRLEYNTTRGPLKMAEYGRNIQKMVEYLLTIPDKAERTKAAYALVKSMEIVAPEQRDFQDLRRKLWDHLYIISDYRLDVDGHILRLLAKKWNSNLSLYSIPPIISDTDIMVAIFKK